MDKKLFKLFVYIYLAINCQNLIAQSQGSVLVIGTAVEATLPDDLQTGGIDDIIKDLKDKLPNKLETQIFDLARGRILFLDRELLMEFKHVIDYEKPNDLINAMSDTLKKKINAVLMTKIEKLDATRITIRGKVVRLDRIILSVRDVDTYLDPQSVFNSERSLAKAIVEDLVSTSSSNWLVSPKIPLLSNRKISYLTTSFAISTVGTFLWYKNEKKIAESNITKYNSGQCNASTVVAAERADVRRLFAKRINIASGIIFLVSFANDLFLQSKPIEENILSKKDWQNGFRFEIEQDLFTQSFYLKASTNF